MAGSAVKGWPKACPVAKVAKDFSMFSLERPGMPWLQTLRRSRTEHHQGTALRHGVTNRTGAGENLARLADMAIVMTSEASRPVAMADIVRIGRPVDFHCGKDVSIVNGEDGIYGLVNLGFLILHDLRIVLGIVCFNRLPNCLVYVVLIVILFY